jgi:hypothetical protein
LLCDSCLWDSRFACGCEMLQIREMKDGGSDFREGTAGILTLLTLKALLEY